MYLARALSRSKASAWWTRARRWPTGDARPSFGLSFETGQVVMTGRFSPSLTFTRATTATVLGYAADAVSGASQIVIPVASGEMRIQGARRVSEGVYSNVLADGTPITGTIGYLAEGARTNLTWPSVPDPTNWSIYPPSSADVSSSTFVNVDGTSTARFVKALATTGSHGTYHGNNTASIGTSNGTIYTAWWYLKAGTLTKARPQITTASAADGVYAEFDLSNGTILKNATTLNAAVPVANSAFIELIGNGWYKCGFSYTANAGLASVTFQTVQVLSAAGSNNYTGDGTSGLYVGGDQLEVGAFASSYQPTTTAAVARNADVLTCPFAGIGNDVQGAVYIEAITSSTTGNGTSSIPLAFSSNSSLLYLNSGDARTVINSYDGTTVVTKTGLTDISTALRKRACSWGNGGMSITGDGAAPATSVFDGSLGSTSITIGAATGGTSQWFGVIKAVRIYRSRLRDAQLQAMTS